MKFLKLKFKSRHQKRQEDLLKQYNEGKILQIGNGIDNKQNIKSLEGSDGAA